MTFSITTFSITVLCLTIIPYERCHSSNNTTPSTSVRNFMLRVTILPLSCVVVRVQLCKVLWYNKLLGIKQVYYWRKFYKTHKHYNYLQWLLKQKVFTKVIKMPSLKAQMERPMGLIKRGSRAQALYVKLQNCLIKSKKYFLRLNICNPHRKVSLCWVWEPFCLVSFGWKSRLPNKMRFHWHFASLHFTKTRASIKTLYNRNLVRLLHQLLLAWGRSHKTILE